MSEQLDEVISRWTATMPVREPIPTLYRIWRQSRRFLDMADQVGVEECSRLMMLLRSSYVPPEATIGRGSNFAYGGISVVLHRRSVIGNNVNIGQNVTIGAKDRQGANGSILSGAPRIGEGTFIGPGATVLGPITIGPFSIIGANSVVTKSLPAGSIVGVPEMRSLTRVTEDNLLKYRSLYTPMRGMTDDEILSRFKVVLAQENQ